MKINEQKDRPDNPYYRHREVDIPQDDFSEDSGPNDIYFDWAIAEEERIALFLARRERSIR